MTLSCCQIVQLFILVLFSCVFVVAQGKECQFDKHKNDKETLPAYKKLMPLVGKRYSVVFEEKYEYIIGICTEAQTGVNDEAGVLQVIQGSSDSSTNENAGDSQTTSKQFHMIGSLDHADIKAGDDWIMLEYKQGDPYGTHCGKEARTAVIMITCNEDIGDQEAKIHLIEESNNKSEACYYLFELSHKAICPGDQQLVSFSMSVGSVILIVFFCVGALYLLGGLLYNRYVIRAKGLEQIPNFSFWQDFGNLQSDGCNFVCRSRENKELSNPYKGLGDDQLQEEDERDDHLLPM